jgi:hypothetical protein
LDSDLPLKILDIFLFGGAWRIRQAIRRSTGGREAQGVLRGICGRESECKTGQR